MTTNDMKTTTNNMVAINTVTGLFYRRAHKHGTGFFELRLDAASRLDGPESAAAKFSFENVEIREVESFPARAVVYAGLEAIKVGVPVTLAVGTCRYVGTVKEVMGWRALVDIHETTLLNPVASCAPDAMTASPGGFCAHFEGVQRYDVHTDVSVGQWWIAYSPGLRVDSLLAGLWAKVGAGRRGLVTLGWNRHRDFNF